MASARLVLGIIFGIILSVFTIGAFTMWKSFIEIQTYFGTDFMKVLYVLFRDNFAFEGKDLFSLFMGGSFNMVNLLSPQMLSWLLVGFIGGSIAKGLKRGLLTGIIIVVVDILLWIVFGILEGEDMFNLFLDTNALTTIGGIISGLIGGIAGGCVGGAISGPYEGL